MLKVNELFSGIGSQSAALKRLGINFKIIGIAEIDKYAIKSYEAIHGVVKNYGDISKVEKLDYADFWTYSFPCQDISVAGKQAGIKHRKTRSGLLYEVERLLEKSQELGELPKYLMLENVKNLVGKKFKPQFEEWIQRLDELGFNTYWQVLNAKNYGVPQNRERVFGISIRKDVDDGKFEFPKPLSCDNLDFRDYLSEDGFYLEPSDYDKVKGLGAKYSFGGVVKDNTSIYNAITANYGKVSGNSMKFTYHDKYRYLKPKECWRLMGFTDEEFQKAQDAGVSNSQLYKQAGNSIVVDVLECIFRNLLK